MPAMLIGHHKGDPAEVLAAYDRAVPLVAEASRAKPHHHFCASTPDGIVCVDIWESEEEIRAFLNSSAREDAMLRAGLPLPVDIQVMPVHNSGWTHE